MQGKFIIFVLLSAVFLCSSVQAWGADGHQIVAQIAQDYLTATAWNNMQPYLNGYQLYEISTWPDDFSHSTEGSWSEPLHYVNLPSNATHFLYIYCAPQYTGSGCVVTAIQNYTSILGNEFNDNQVSKCVDASSGDIEPCPLSFLVHFIGDVHQPLHVSYSVDEGGNYVDIDFLGKCTNLHSVWDTYLIEHYEDVTGDAWNDIAQMLSEFIGNHPLTAGNWTEIYDPAQWATESEERMRTEAYNFQPGSVSPHSAFVNSTQSLQNNRNNNAPRSSCTGYVLGQAYYNRVIPYIFDQLMKGGSRLAYHLNTIFDPTFNATVIMNPNPWWL